jgi:hypothetical protein
MNKFSWSFSLFHPLLPLIMSNTNVTPISVFSYFNLDFRDTLLWHVTQ